MKLNLSQKWFFFNKLNARPDHWRSVLQMTSSKLMTSNLIPGSVIFKGDTVHEADLMQNGKFRLICSKWSQRVPFFLTKKTSTHTLCYLELKVTKSCLMSAIAVKRLLTRTNRMRIGVAHHVTALIFYNITRCYGKHVAVFAIAVAMGDLKYQSFVYGSFVWGIHVRYNKRIYDPYKWLLSDLLISKICFVCVKEKSQGNLS